MSNPVSLETKPATIRRSGFFVEFYRRFAYYEHALRDRLTVGRVALNHEIGVRFPVPQHFDLI